jgi:5-formyltetrahydrofolate cyclo-ligase
VAADVDAVDLAKEDVREVVWTLLEGHRAVPIPPGAHDRIPNFIGAEVAADRIGALTEWQRARAVKANPDKAQLALRRRALEEGKLVYMAVPRLAKDRPFVLLDPAELGGSFDTVSTSGGGVALGRPVDVRHMEPIDLVVCGTVAVNRQGVRIGKGGGFSDLEVALLTHGGLVGAETPIVTTVHQLQVLDEDLPATEHDFRVDWVATPDEMFRSESVSHPLSGIRWDHLTKEKVAAIPALRRLAAELNKTELLV